MAKTNSLNNSSAPFTIDPSSSSNTYIKYEISSVSKFTTGVDNTNSSYHISSGGTLGTNDALTITSGGQITKPLQSAFLTIVNTTIANVTGNDTEYTIAWDTEIFDQNNDLSGSTFTAPVTGRYYFESGVLGGGIALAMNNSGFSITTSNRTYYMQVNCGNSRVAATGNFSFYTTVLGDMDTGDTAVVKLNVIGGGQVVDVLGSGSSATVYSWFSGNLEI
jgi:hypothetical protein